MIRRHGGLLEQGVSGFAGVESPVAGHSVELALIPEIREHVGVRKIRAPGAEAQLIVLRSHPFAQRGIRHEFELQFHADVGQVALEDGGDLLPVGTAFGIDQRELQSLFIAGFFKKGLCLRGVI